MAVTGSAPPRANPTGLTETGNYFDFISAFLQLFAIFLSPSSPLLVLFLRLMPFQGCPPDSPVLLKRDRGPDRTGDASVVLCYSSLC